MSMSESILDVSRDSFFEVLKPILEREYPVETSQTAFGVFGYGSEVLRLDDTYSADHHWGLRINALMPDYLFRGHHDEIMETVEKNLPEKPIADIRYARGSLALGLSLVSLEGYLGRTIGIAEPPETFEQWLAIPEEDIIHVINGEIWHR